MQSISIKFNFPISKPVHKNSRYKLNSEQEIQASSVRNHSSTHPTHAKYSIRSAVNALNGEGSVQNAVDGEELLMHIAQNGILSEVELILELTVGKDWADEIRELAEQRKQELEGSKAG